MKKKVQVGVINVTMHPHSPKRYVELFRSARAQNMAIHLQGTSWAELADVHEVSKSDAEVKPIYGEIYKYTNFDPKADWYNKDTKQHATEEELEDTKQIDHLRPESTRFTFIFYPDEHLIVYSQYEKSKNFTPNLATEFFNALLNLSQLQEIYGEINVTHQPEENAVTEIIKLPSKRKLEMTITRPNALKSAEQKYLKKMKKRKVQKIKEELTADSDNAIEVDDELKDAIKIAAKYGNVKTSGKNDQGERVTIDTNDTPFSAKDFYDDKHHTAMEAFRMLAETVLDQFR
ncbi:DUF4747 family protein [Pseudoalteromonas rubra]|uniref:DUF4747 family protein n=1 Tax=Pseudoalteromonas rubra TaxID=43658 RepID=UPI002DBB6E01|nr:DUF4747 family protein [Pseudoalteromonas rubra]MEC4091867.1 DUF4747 family protein [Pseudoalteromonas rubra]